MCRGYELVKPSGTQSYQRSYQDLLAYIEDNYHNEITESFAAETVGLSISEKMERINTMNGDFFEGIQRFRD
ncbi:hypothetical protein AGMMS50239_37960 [Bacteroidia bacterium]|nr:hypothetical protein AGMMS50239_37960 [Bacteroidia bacterium]